MERTAKPSIILSKLNYVRMIIIRLNVNLMTNAVMLIKMMNLDACNINKVSVTKVIIVIENMLNKKKDN